MKNKTLTLFLLLTQCAGVIFYGVFSAAYMLALPSYNILTGEPIFHLLLSVFGALFLTLTIAAVLLSVVAKTKNEKRA